MNIVKSLEELAKKKRKTLSERQALHLEATIAYLKALPKDFGSAVKEYKEIMSHAKDH